MRIRIEGSEIEEAVRKIVESRFVGAVEVREIRFVRSPARSGKKGGVFAEADVVFDQTTIDDGDSV